MTAEKRIRGTREWAVATVDCCVGCSHACRYCYARYDRVVRKGLVGAEEWQMPRVLPEEVDRVFPRYAGTVLFPANHDIQPEILDDCLRLLRGLLVAGNNVLIVSKPHRRCIEAICDQFADRRQQILFRFSITAADDRLLHFWEPGAPDYAERLASLELAWHRGFATSVSIEPMLDSDNIGSLVAALSPFVSHSIWLGKMNRIGTRVVCDSPEVEEQVRHIRETQSDACIHAIYERFKDNPLIRWKDSIKEVVGLPPAAEPGLDI